MSSGKVVLGILAGAAIGAMFGILFAPDKGSLTRKKITKKGHKLADDLSIKFDEFISSISERFERVKEDLTHVAENGMGESSSSDSDRNNPLI